MAMKNIYNGGGHRECSGIKRVTNANIKINTIRPLEDLSNELSEKFGKKIEVVDVLEEFNYEKYYSVITGKTIDPFFIGYEYNKAGYSNILVDFKKSLNLEETKHDAYCTVLVFKEV
jgi:hypothetical protein